MKNIIIILFGVAVNIAANYYLRAAKMNIESIVPNLYLFCIVPVLLIIILIVSILYDRFKRKNKQLFLSKLLIVIFLSALVIQFLLIANRVYALDQIGKTTFKQSAGLQVNF